MLQHAPTHPSSTRRSFSVLGRLPSGLLHSTLCLTNPVQPGFVTPEMLDSAKAAFFVWVVFQSLQLMLTPELPPASQMSSVGTQDIKAVEFVNEDLQWESKICTTEVKKENLRHRRHCEDCFLQACVPKMDFFAMNCCIIIVPSVDIKSKPVAHWLAKMNSTLSHQNLLHLPLCVSALVNPSKQKGRSTTATKI